MFGKPSPNGSGNGWKGWIDGKHFRSLRELVILIELIDTKSIFESGEQAKYAINYIDCLGVKRTYFPDYIVFSSKQIIEIKPKRLWGTPSVKRKSSVGKIFAESMGFNYVLKDPIIESNKIKAIIHRIKFYPKYEKKFWEWQTMPVR